MFAPGELAGLDGFEGGGPAVSDAELFIERDGGAPDEGAVDGERDGFGCVEEGGIGDEGELGDVGEGKVDAVATGGFGVDGGGVAGRGEGVQTGPEGAAVERGVGLVHVSAGVEIALVFQEPTEDFVEVFDGAVVAFIGEGFKDGVGAEFAHAFQADGDAAMVELVVVGAGDPERWDVCQIASEPGVAVGGGEGRGGGEHVRVAHGEIRSAGAAHGVAGEVDSFGIDGVAFTHFFEHGQDVVFADAAVLGDAAAVGTDDDDAVLFGGLSERDVLVGGVVEEGVFIASGAMHGDDKRGGCGMGFWDVEAVGLGGVVDGRGVGEAEVLLGEKREGDQQDGDAEHAVSLVDFGRRTPDGLCERSWFRWRVVLDAAEHFAAVAIGGGPGADVGAVVEEDAGGECSRARDGEVGQ